MDLTKLDELKLLMQTGRSLEAIWEYFLDNFAENQDFLSHGELLTGDDHLLCRVAEQVALKILQRYKPGIRPSPPVGRTWVHLQDRHFIHGGMWYCGYMTNVLYFEDIMLGMLFVYTNQSEFSRFSLAGPPAGSLNRN